jgi:hypothetical protein
LESKLSVSPEYCTFIHLYNNNTMQGLSCNGDDFFDFEAASSSAPLAGMNENPTQQIQTIHAEEMAYSIPLTKSEIEAILAARASKAPNCHCAHRLAPARPTTGHSRSEGFGADCACFNYNDGNILVPTDFTDFVMPRSGNVPLDPLGGFESFDGPQFEDPADGACQLR